MQQLPSVVLLWLPQCVLCIHSLATADTTWTEASSLIGSFEGGRVRVVMQAVPLVDLSYGHLSSREGRWRGRVFFLSKSLAAMRVLVVVSILGLVLFLCVCI